MGISNRWRKDKGARVQGSRDLDQSKVQAPGAIRLPSGGYRLFYTAVGPAKPFPDCQGYILSATSNDGLNFEVDPGIRVAPDPSLPHMSLRLLAPSVVQVGDSQWRMYFEARGPADRPTVICSAVSSNLLNWEHEDGIRLEKFDGLGGPRIVPIPDGRLRLYCFASEYGPGGKASGERISQNVVSAISTDGINFEMEPGYRLRHRTEADALGITAADVIPPASPQKRWRMFYSSWQDASPNTEVPLHPSQDVNAVASGTSEDFAAASIACDIAGFRSRIFVATSDDGLNWTHGDCVIEGGGYECDEIDGVHAEDMSVIAIGENAYRIYYAACDRLGNWRIASATIDSLE